MEASSLVLPSLVYERVGSDQVQLQAVQLASDDVEFMSIKSIAALTLSLQPQAPKCLDLWPLQRTPRDHPVLDEPTVPREASGQDTALGLRAQLTTQEQAYSFLRVDRGSQRAWEDVCGETSMGPGS